MLKEINESIKYYETKTETGIYHYFKDLNLDSKPRDIQVFLPSDYYENQDTNYRVVYMHDGNTAFEAGGLSPWSWEADKTVNSLMESGQIEPVIIVAVYTEDRFYEYLKEIGYCNDKGDFVECGGGLPDYAAYLSDKLKPFMDKYYRTEPSPEKTMLVGSSFGGTATFYTSCMYPDSFGIGGVFSPSFKLGLGLNSIEQLENSDYINEVIDRLKTLEEKPYLWIDWGYFEPPMREYCPKVIEIMKKKLGYAENKDLIHFEDPKGTHDERAWAYRFGLILKHSYGSK